MVSGFIHRLPGGGAGPACIIRRDAVAPGRWLNPHPGPRRILLPHKSRQTGVEAHTRKAGKSGSKGAFAKDNTKGLR